VITYYTDTPDEYKGLLCSECIKKREKPYTEICPKCKRLAYKHGGMSFFGAPQEHEDMCLECVEKKEKTIAERTAIKLKIKIFVKDHWYHLIALTIGILSLIGFSKLWM
jgi:hypothetical protein